MATLQREPVSKTKRTRICPPQSKYGCLTCKARRIKCDEEKPSCLRCARSGRVCQGYAERIGHTIAAIAKESTREVSFTHGRQATSSPGWSLTFGCVQSGRQHRLAHQGLNLLSVDSFSRFGAAGAVLDTLLPQLCVTIPSINVAATALGAVYQLHASYNLNDPADEVFATSLYRNALRAMRQELNKQPDGPIPLIMICFILSVAEILLQQEANALIHLRAASQLLQQRRNAQSKSHSARPDPLDTNLRSLEDEIGIILRTVDFQICSYAPSRPPDLPAISVPLVLSSVTDLVTAHTTLIPLVHSCYDFARTAFKFKYRPQSAQPSIYIEQGRHLAHLSTWLEQFNLTVLPPLETNSTGQPEDKSYCHALTLRMTALSILIHLSCILNPYETAFNAYATEFQQIVTDGERVMSMRQRESDGSFNGAAKYRFSTGPGLIQPLFLTAYKCRHEISRRRAIALLSIAGREGPWSGRRESRITSRIMELEETWSGDPLLEDHVVESTISEARGRARVLENTEDILRISSTTVPSLARGVDFDPSTAKTSIPEIAKSFDPDLLSNGQQGTISEQASRGPVPKIPEPALINSMGMTSDSSDGRPSNRVIVRFTRCNNMGAMLSHPCGHGRGQAQNLDSHIFGPCVNNPFWDTWEEVLEF